MMTIIERITKASGPDRGIDGLIARDLLGWLPYFDLQGSRILKWHQFAGHWHLPGDPCDHRHPVTEERNPDPPEWTGSIDAAVALVEKKLSWSWRIGNLPSGLAFCQLGANGLEAEGATPPLAILHALFKALPEIQSSTSVQ